MIICNLEIKISLIPFLKIQAIYERFLAEIESIIKVWDFFLLFDWNSILEPNASALSLVSFGTQERIISALFSAVNM